ncbi:MAG: reverse transcriptase/maturase family protein, partial [Actinomycetota bacterium]|nr:reverse transcriptase/maturase family protein [Actinomycetota bacterium]
MSSGSYFPPPVRAVEIPKPHGGGIRVLGVPTLADRIAQTVDCRWVLLYVKRWLAAPLQLPDGTLHERDKGTPQGSAVSPVLANLFMHYAFDSWMVRNFPGCPFERYADDAVVHCKTRRQAEYVRNRIAQRMEEVGLRLHPDK